MAYALYILILFGTGVCIYTVCNRGGIGLCEEHIWELYTVYLTRFQTYKIALSPETEEGSGPQTDKHLPSGLFKEKLKKNRHLGLESISYRYLVHGSSYLRR